jgi:hypothetical protein
VNEHQPKSSDPGGSSPLEARFLDFLAGLPGSERIDGLSLPSQQGVEIADFLLADRRVIIEVRSLEKDTASKVQEVLQRHETRPEYPIFYGDWPLETAAIEVRTPSRRWTGSWRGRWREDGPVSPVGIGDEPI